MRNACFIVSLSLALWLCGRVAAQSSEATEAVKHHRFGLLGAITEERWKGGFVLELEHFEAQLLAHAGFSSGGDREVDTQLKLGGRLDIGTRNWLAFGAEFDTFAGSREGGHNLGGSFSTGPYLSIQRYFADTPVMLCLWVNPVRYDQLRASGVPGYPQHEVRIFQTGGFGIAYLFL